MIVSAIKPLHRKADRLSRRVSRPNLSLSILTGTIIRHRLDSNIQETLRNSRVLYFYRSRTLQVTCDRMTAEEIYGVKLVRNLKAIEPYLKKFAINCESVEIMQRLQNGKSKRFVKFATHDPHLAQTAYSNLFF